MNGKTQRYWTSTKKNNELPLFLMKLGRKLCWATLRVTPKLYHKMVNGNFSLLKGWKIDFLIFMATMLTTIIGKIFLYPLIGKCEDTAPRSIRMSLIRSVITHPMWGKMCQ